MYIIILFMLAFSDVGIANKFKIIKEICIHRDVKNIIIADCESNYKFLLMSKEFSKINLFTKFYDLSKNSENVPLLLERYHTNIGVVLNMNCVNSVNFIQQMSKYDYPVFNFTNKWLLLDIQLNNSIKILSELNINVDAEIIYAENFKNDSYNLYDVYNTGKKNRGRLFIKYLGNWTKNAGLNLTPQKYKYVERKDLSDVILKSTIVITSEIKEKLENFITSTKDTHLDSMNRFNYVLLLYLKDIYKFNYQMSRTLSWGYLHNNTFDGMIGQLERKEIDIGGSPIFFKKERLKVIDYTIQTWISRPCFIFRHPRKTSILKIYIKPFDVNVWCCAIAIILLTIIIIFFLNNAQHKMRPSLYNSSLSEIVLFILGAIFQQGIFNNLSLISGRIVTFTLFTFSLLFYQFYSGSIVSSLLSKPPKTIKTLKNLLDSDLKVGIEDIIYAVDYFQKTTDTTALELYRKKISNNKMHNLFPPDIGLKMVKHGSFAFHVDTATAYKIITETFSEREICELSEVNLFPTQKMITIVQKRSPYRKLITYGLRKISESGLMTRQRSIWHAKKPRCIETLDVSKFNVSIIEFSSALILLLIGMLISIIILILEIIYSK